MKTEQTLQMLKKLRARIDRADRQLLTALGERFKVAQEIGWLKEQLNLPVHQKSRWAEVVKDRLKFSKKVGLQRSFVQDLLTMIHTESLNLQTGSKKKKKLQ